jgi:hypothetical protein
MKLTNWNPTFIATLHSDNAECMSYIGQLRVDKCRGKV